MYDNYYHHVGRLFSALKIKIKILATSQRLRKSLKDKKCARR